LKKTLLLRFQTESRRMDKITENKKKYDSYTAPDWIQITYYEDTGGYIITHAMRTKHSNKSIGIRAEKKVNEMLARKGEQILMLPDNVFDEIDKIIIDGKTYRTLLHFDGKARLRGYPDEFFRGKTWDIKSINEANVETIRSYIKEARKADNVIFFWDNSSKLEELKEAVVRSTGYFKKQNQLSTMPDVYFIDKDGCLYPIWKKKEALQPLFVGGEK
jgi:hypothetical protein